MTPLQLLDALEAFVKQETKDILLPVRVDRKSGENKERAAEVYKMRLPNKTAQTERVPYLLLQYIKSTDTQEQGQDPESECTVRIVAATYSEDESEGAMCVLNLLTPISEFMGPSTAQMAGNSIVLADVEEKAQEVINKRVEHEITRILNGYGG